MTATTSGPPDAILGESGPIPLRDVEAELSRRLKAAQGDGAAPVLRAHMSNVVIYCDSAEEARRVEAVVPQVVAEHPARVLLLVAEPGEPSADVTATVHVRALRAGGGARVFAEQVTLRARGHGVDHLPYAVRSLSIGDLPTNVCWASHVPPPLAGPLLYDLTERAQQVIYDSLGWLDPNRGVAATATWLSQFEHRPGRWRVASDLNWRRLKTWRRVLGEALAPATAPGALASITEVAMEHGPHAVTQAWQLMSWLASRLGWSVKAGRVQDGKELSWQALAPHGPMRLRIHRLDEGPPEVRRLRIACLVGGKPGALDIVADGGRLTVTPEGIDASPRTVTAPPQVLAELIARQLSDRERDPVFFEAMSVAQILARSALG